VALRAVNRCGQRPKMNDPRRITYIGAGARMTRWINEDSPFGQATQAQTPSFGKIGPDERHG